MRRELHIICGRCGSNEHLTYAIKKDWIVENEGLSNELIEDGVVVYCSNCGHNSSLDELIPREVEQ